jgi:protein-disulfide isomerase
VSVATARRLCQHEKTLLYASHLCLKKKEKTTVRAVLTLLTLTIPLFLAAVPAQANRLTEDRVKEIVEAYIKENPKMIFEAVSAYLLQEEQRAAQAAVDEAFANPIPFELGSHTPIRGDKNAPVTIIQFAEFECPYCATANDTLLELMRRYKSKVRIAYVHLPLSFHKQAEPAAVAAMAAHNQGKFWEYNDILFANQDKLGEAFYVQTARELKLDMARFEKDRKDAKILEQVRQDARKANAIGVRGTPHFLINGVALNGARPIESFEAVIERHLADLNKKK